MSNFIYIFSSIMIFITISYGFSNQKNASIALNAMSFKKVEFTSHGFFSCGSGDWYTTGFKAINRDGLEVKGVVCSGLFLKKSTVRFS